MAVITGTAGNDILGATTVADTLKGLAGDDSYYVTGYKNVVSESANTAKANFGIDTIYFSSNFYIGTGKALAKTYTLSANVENLNLAAWDLSANTYFSTANRFVINGNALSNTITLGDKNSSQVGVWAGAGNDVVIGGSGNNYIDGGVGYDYIAGGAGNDFLYGGEDALIDTLYGGTGADTYLLRDNKDAIWETNDGSANTLQLTSNFTDAGVDLTNNAVGYDYSADNILTIDAANTRKGLNLIGNANKATAIFGGIGNDYIVGGTGNDYISGGAGNDVIVGGIGADTIYGGKGNDTYYVEDLFTDNIIEYGNEGVDTLVLSASAPLIPAGTASLASFSAIENLDASALTAGTTLIGNGLSNILVGGSGSDIMYGGGGVEADVLVGGKGSDIYFVGNSKNQVIEQANEGYDKVVLDKNFNSNTFALNSNVEFLDATTVKKGMTLGGSAGSGTTVYGTSYNDKITGGTGGDVINGYAGNDAIYGGAGADSLDGGDGADYIDGGTGDDTLFGGGDNVADTLIGGDGSDIYRVKDTKDVIKDTSSGNLIRISDLFTENSFSLGKNISGADYTAATIGMLDAHHVDHGLTLSANSKIIKTNTYTVTPATATTKATTLTTTTISGVDALIYGTDFSDTIIGYLGNDTLWAGFGDSTMYGGGDDTLFGGAGTNTLLGGIGDDTYLIDGTATATTITELADTDKINYGIDTIKLITNNGAFSSGLMDATKVNTAGSLNNLATFSISLASYANVENLDASLITTTNLNLTGSDITKTQNKAQPNIGNIIIGGGGNDTITGGSKDDTISGGNGDDTISGGKGVNILDGGNGNDTYKISVDDEESINGNSWVWDPKPNAVLPRMLTSITDGSGIDTIILTGKSSYDKDHYEKFEIDMTKTTIENLDASAIIKDLGLKITGNALDNFIIDGTGHDTVDSGAGDDTIFDYATYTDSDGVEWSLGNIINAGTGNNTVVTGAGNDYITALNGDDFIYDYGGDNIINAGDGKNRVYTGAGQDYITTGTGDDYIISGDGDDYIDGGTGSNTLFGCTGDDTYIINSLNDTVLEEDNSGNDTLKLSLSSTISSLDLANYENFENLDGAWSLSPTLTLTGNNLDNTLTSGFGANLLIGKDGNDTYCIHGGETSVNITDTSGTDTIKLLDDGQGQFNGQSNATVSLAAYADIENLDGSEMIGAHLGDPKHEVLPTDLILTGNALNNKITGGSGNDTLNGGAGVNTLTGGLGDDTYIISSASDKCIEAANGGNDTIQLVGGSTPFSFSLAGYNNIENLDGSQYTGALTITGDASDNTLVGGLGSNTLIGGDGNDTYFLNSTVNEITETGGIDTVMLSSTSAVLSVDLSTYANVENIDASLSNNILTLTGNTLANTIVGGTNINILNGGAGDDIYVINSTSDTINESAIGGGIDTIRILATSNIPSLDISVPNFDNIENIDGSLSTSPLILSGNGLDNLITSGTGDDTLFGGAGANILTGGAGNDTYLIDGSESITSIRDVSGLDKIKLIADGSGKFDGNTTDIASLAAYNSIEGLDASSITNTDLTLTGNHLDNTITAGWGADTLFGDVGDDTYIINNASSTIIEKDGEGNDTIKLSSVSIITSVKLADPSHKYLGVENLDGSLSSKGLTLNGNISDNIIIGGSGSNILQGDMGNDTLIAGSGSNILQGDSGNDTYIINKASDSVVEGSSNTDTLDIVKLSKTASGFASMAISDYSGIEEIDGSLYSGGLNLTGDYEDNILIGGIGNNTIFGGAGNDTLCGGIGMDTYNFVAGDEKDYINGSDPADVINIDYTEGITTADMLFYTDASNNFYADYTAGGVGIDVIEIGSYDKGTTIRIGTHTIDINSIIQNLSAATKGLDASAISNLNMTTEANQVALLTWTP